MLISFEGIDGSGKSTQIELLKEFLITSGQKVQVFREPGGSEVSEKIRSILLDAQNEIDPVTEIFLFSSARSHLVHHAIKPAMESGDIVILDRFYDSTTAYQGFGRDVLKPEEILKINTLASHHIEPDATIYLHLNYEDALERRSSRESEDRMEKADRQFFERVIEGYQWLSEKYAHRYKTISANQELNNVHQLILQELGFSNQ